jgi:putative hemolysin
MLLWLLGRVPQTGDRVDWEQWRLEVVDMDGRRIDKVLAMPKTEPLVEENGEYPSEVELPFPTNTDK